MGSVSHLYSARNFVAIHFKIEKIAKESGITLAYRNKVAFHRQPMFSVIILQSVATVLIGLLFWLLQGWQAAYSAWFGGLTALIPNVYFTYKAFQYFGARSIGVIVQSFWAGEMGKLILTAVLFAVLFLGVKPLNVLAVFVGYILVQMTSATSLLLTKSFLKR